MSGTAGFDPSQEFRELRPIMLRGFPIRIGNGHAEVPSENMIAVKESLDSLR